MSEYLNEMIGYNVQGTAEWRRQKAEEFPDDTRNVTAAEELERLGEQIDAIKEDCAIHKQIVEAHDAINRISDGGVYMDISEDVSSELRSIGFHGTFSTGQKLLEWYRDLLIQKFHDLVEEAVQAPDLDAQVANDPTVQDAKRAYDEAYAYAHAEARKRL
jgi:hypothetical protein